jgi:hypothetical protein
VHVADLGGSRGDESRERVDELAGFVEVGLGGGIVGEPDLDGGRAHQVHGRGGDDLDGRHVGDVAGGGRGCPLLLLPPRLALGVHRRRVRRRVVLVSNRVHAVLSDRLLRSPVRSASDRKVDHIPPALAVPGYRVTHSAPTVLRPG